MKYEVGKSYRIEFLDHGQGYIAPLEFTVEGSCAKNEKGYLVITCWYFSKGFKSDETNEMFFTILKSTIQKAKEIK